jgi:hypothetical protein
LLELGALAAFGIWGWRQGDGPLGLVLGLGLPLGAASLWALTAVKDDPTRSGRAFLPVPGALRLILELAYFGLAGWMIWDIGMRTLASVFVVVVAILYLLSYDRIAWLLRQR